MNMNDLPNGTLVEYRDRRYFVSEGLEGRIITGEDGHWQFLKDMNWKSFRVLSTPLTHAERKAIRKIRYVVEAYDYDKEEWLLASGPMSKTKADKLANKRNEEDRKKYIPPGDTSGTFRVVLYRPRTNK